MVLLVLVMCVAACEHNEAQGQTGSGSGSSKKRDDIETEQARFDEARHPEKVVEALGIKPGSRVADVGAGSGLLTVHLARAVKPNGKVVATDIDTGVLDLMHTRLLAAGLDDYVERRVVGADTPDLMTKPDDPKYDAILLAEVDHYFTDEVAWLKAAIPALKPGGRIVISNRIHHRAKSIASATKAGLELLNELTPVQTHFIAVFVVPKPK
jgi:ubiquinone/menaquinone biosynthesis C-methylase UbiE